MRSMRKRPFRSIDNILLTAVTVLVFIGIVMVFSSSWPEAIKDGQSQYYYALRQAIFAIIGFVIMFFLTNVDYHYYRNISLKLYIASLFTVLLIFTPLGVEFQGATRWIRIFGITFMPSDLLKISSILYISTLMANKRDRITHIKEGFFPVVIVIFLTAAFIWLQKDLGTLLALSLTILVMYIVAGMDVKLLAGSVFVGFLIIIFTLQKALKLDPSQGGSVRLRRIATFIRPFEDPLGDGWQIVQSLYAIGSGGIKGMGLGKSKQKFFYMSEPFNDFIFAIIGEELGFIGAVLIILVYMIIVSRGVKIAIGARDDFGRYMATGITGLIAIQSLIHIGVVVSAIPTTGITLPFVSAGGTSLITFMALTGILLNISKTSRID